MNLSNLDPGLASKPWISMHAGQFINLADSVRAFCTFSGQQFVSLLKINDISAAFITLPDLRLMLPILEMHLLMSKCQVLHKKSTRSVVRMTCMLDSKSSDAICYIIRELIDDS